MTPALKPLETTDCGRCDGGGQLANTDDREPWSAWTSLPYASQVAVRMGIVRPVPCDVCHGRGQVLAEPFPVELFGMRMRNNAFGALTFGEYLRAGLLLSWSQDLSDPGRRRWPAELCEELVRWRLVEGKIDEVGNVDWVTGAEKVADVVIVAALSAMMAKPGPLKAAQAALVTCLAGLERPCVEASDEAIEHVLDPFCRTHQATELAVTALRQFFQISERPASERSVPANDSSPVRAAGLGLAAQLVYTKLALYARASDWVAYPLLAVVAEETALPEDTVKRAMQQLVEAGLVVEQRLGDGEAGTMWRLAEPTAPGAGA